MNQSIKNKLLPLITALSAIGAAVSVWQTHLFYMTRGGMGGMHSFCNIGQTFDCTAIEMSRYSEFIGGMPLSSFATSGYLLILILSLFGFSDSLKKNVKPFLITFTSIALLFSAAYLVIMLMLIGKFCLICLAVDAINLLLFLCAICLPSTEESHGTSPSGIRIGQFSGAAVTALLLALIFTKGVDPLASQKTEDVNDIIESVMNAPVTTFTFPADAPMIGNPSAPITVVKFSDYQCPACRMAAEAIHPLLKRYPNDVKFVFVNFPLATECNPDPALKQTMHPFACEAAAVAVCAQAQGKFSETYEALFENQAAFKDGEIASMITSKVPGLDLEKLKECAKLPSTSAKIKSDAQLGMQVKITSTPTFFINGKKIEGGLPTSIWMNILDKMTSKP